jgi:hypothetical protein
MGLEAGQDYIGDSSTVTYEAGETISPGSVVGIESGALREVNSGDSDTNAIGVAGHGGGADGGEDYEDGDEVPVHVRGSGVIVSVADGVSAGVELGATTTDGELGASDGGGFIAVTDENAVAGLSSDESVPDGHAVCKTP